MQELFCNITPAVNERKFLNFTRVFSKIKLVSVILENPATGTQDLYTDHYVVLSK